MRCKYIGDSGRYYPSLGITPKPGDFYELESDPADGRWVAMDESHAASAAEEEAK